jgi:hypothetical protein
MSKNEDVRVNKGIIAGANASINVGNLVTGEGNKLTIGRQAIDQRVSRERAEVLRQLAVVAEEVRRHGAELENVAAVKQELQALATSLARPAPDAPGLLARLERLAGTISRVTTVGAVLQPVIDAVRGWL